MDAMGARWIYLRPGRRDRLHGGRHVQLAGRFAYYPLLNHFSLDLKMPAKTLRPVGMMYYGWIVTVGG